MQSKAILALADGSLFHGQAIGATGSSVGEVVFNTAITGYQEILTDPSYCQQIVTLTQPHIGNVGTNREDDESDKMQVAGLVIRDLPLALSNWRNEVSLDERLRQENIVAIADIDTRRLTRVLRDKGAQNGCILSGETVSEETALQRASEFAGIKGADLAKVVSTTENYDWNQGTWNIESGLPEPGTNGQYRVVAYDFGVKRNILRILTDLGCRLTVVPATTPAAEVLALQPQGVFLSNGPGDPDPCDYAIHAIEEFLEQGMPLFGICLGHQLLALAAGASTVKMKCGHHGANHPVVDLASGRVMITSQNHGFAVDEDSLPAHLASTHRSLFDGTVQGIEHRDRPAFGFQGHPEASPGPHDVKPLFEKFIQLMQQTS